MGKISPVAAKYIIHANIDIEGVVDRPDVIGAIFGQTEGLLGEDLELRELQKSGRIGRIEVNTDTRSGKTKGSIIIPSSLDKAETSIVGAALEIIQRIGPCNAKIEVTKIEDVRVSKRSMVVERAKELLRKMMDSTMPDSQELADEVTASVRVMEIIEYGADRLPAGPAINESDEIIIVEGRADVLNLLKHGFKNAIAINGTSVPESIIELAQKKVCTAFVDGDRGGNLIIKELTMVADIDFVTKAPDGKEVEEITKKEIHKAIRSRISGEQAKLELSKETERTSMSMTRRPQPSPNFQARPPMQSSQGPRPPFSHSQAQSAPAPRKTQVTNEEKAVFKSLLEDLIGTRGAEILDSKLAVLGKVPISEIQTALKSINNAHAVVFDGCIERPMVEAAEKSNVKFLVAMDSKVKPSETRVGVLTVNEL
ncbi:MAG TPA: DNA primase DnaG [Candidatus Nanoarchaeia archaeon]|nr:DNA primase DnaG [Candidatus Nanoarchaeia archaeon]